MNYALRQLMITPIIILAPLFARAQETPQKIWVTFASHDDVPTYQENQLVSGNTSIQTLITNFSITSVEQAVPASQREDMQRVYEVTCSCDAALLSDEIRKGEVPLYQPEPAPNYELLNEPNDYLLNYTSDYALDLINAQQAWDYSTGDPSTIIGISDGNYYVSHEDLEGKIVYVEPGNYTSNYYHGTAVAITAAGHTNNGAGKSSIGYDCNLHLTITNYNKVLQMSQAGIRVINLSWASSCFESEYIQNIITEAYDNGAIIVAAAGNGTTCGGASNLVYPASCDHVISVTSIGMNDNHEKILGDPNSTHQHNAKVDICAPGYGVPVSIAPEYYNHSNGSSFAAPFVSGTIGLMLSHRPCLSFEEVEEILKASADDISSTNPTYTNLLGAGRLNAGRALEITENYCLGSPVDPGSSGTVVTNTDSTITTEPIDSTFVPNDETPGASANPTDQTADFQKITSADIHLFPNPTTHYSTLKWEGNDAVELYCYDSRGSLIDQQYLSGGNETTIELERPGVYIIRLVHDQEVVWHERLVKL